MKVTSREFDISLSSDEENNLEFLEDEEEVWMDSENVKLLWFIRLHFLACDMLKFLT